jgi:type IV secretion system protein VirB10
MSEEEEVPYQVRGERDTNSVARTLSVQSRVSNVLAIGLMSILGLGSLAWYYANAMMRQGRAKQSAQASSTSRAQGDMPLPSLGRIDPPTASPLFDPLLPPRDPPPDQPPLAARTLTEIPVALSSPVMTNGVPQSKTPAELAVERELSGAVFSAPNAAALGTESNAGMLPAIGGSATEGTAMAGTTFGGTSIAASAAGSGGGGFPERQETGELRVLLRPTVTAAVRALVLPGQRLLLPKGAFIDCTLETAIDSTLPGMTTCVMATDAFGVDGKVVLLERGTKLIGETRGQVQQGAARIFVLWTEARTPAGVVVPLDSPGADELGRSGLPGEVNRHFWERFGAAMLVSVVDGAVQAAAQSSHGGSGNVVVNPSASQDVLTEILKNTINVPPTVVKRNGDRIQVLVARDVDFRSVYELRSTADR